MSAVSENIVSILNCPQCNNAVKTSENGIKCTNCGEEFNVNSSNQLDLRLKRKKLYPLQFELGVPLLPEKGFEFKVLSKNLLPAVDFSNIKVPWHLTKELMSYFPKAKTTNSMMLDLGCGNTVHQAVCEYAGFRYIGIDYGDPEAPMLGDAHALPFPDDSFEFVLSIAVLAHIQYPFVMMEEVYRVLKPNGKFIGTVSFLEPFIETYYHHTHLGTYNGLKSAGFTVDRIAPSAEWSVLRAQAEMSLLHKLPNIIIRIILFPLQLLHRLWWKFMYFATHYTKKYKKNRGITTETYRVLSTTGAIAFVATKEENKAL